MQSYTYKCQCAIRIICTNTVINDHILATVAEWRRLSWRMHLRLPDESKRDEFTQTNRFHYSWSFFFPNCVTFHWNSCNFESPPVFPRRAYSDIIELCRAWCFTQWGQSKGSLYHGGNQWRQQGWDDTAPFSGSHSARARGTGNELWRSFRGSQDVGWL